jgi:hypothetical protein
MPVSVPNPYYAFYYYLIITRAQSPLTVMGDCASSAKMLTQQMAPNLKFAQMHSQ